MGRKKKVSDINAKPSFIRYKNRKIYFNNQSRYVTQEEVKQIIASSDGDFEVKGEGLTKEKFLLSVLTSCEKASESDVSLLCRIVSNGGFFAYINSLEAKAAPVTL